MLHFLELVLAAAIGSVVGVTVLLSKLQNRVADQVWVKQLALLKSADDHVVAAGFFLKLAQECDELVAGNPSRSDVQIRAQIREDLVSKAIDDRGRTFFETNIDLFLTDAVVQSSRYVFEVPPAVTFGLESFSGIVQHRVWLLRRLLHGEPSRMLIEYGIDDIASVLHFPSSKAASEHKDPEVAVILVHSQLDEIFEEPPAYLIEPSRSLRERYNKNKSRFGSAPIRTLMDA